MRNNSSCAALESAVKAGDYKKIAELLDEFGLKVDDSWIDYKLLSDAVKIGNPKIVQLLLNHGCRVNKPRANVYSPLHLAVDENHLEIVKILLEHGANANAKCEGSTPLHLTITAKSPEVVKLLLEHKANVCAKNSEDCTPIHKALGTGNCTKILDLMLSAHEGKMTNTFKDEGMSIFHVACTRNQPDVVENFLQRNVDVNECVDMNAYSWGGFTGLHFAAMQSQAEVVRVLLKYKADVNKLCANGMPPLWWGLQYLFMDEIADKLNESLVNYKTTIKDIGVPMKKLVRFVSQEVRKTQTIQLLVEHKSDMNLFNEHGCPLFFEAYRPRILWKFSDEIPNASVIKSICNRHVIESRKKIMKIMINHGVDVNIVHQNGNYLLHYIAEDSDPSTGSIEIAEMILTKGGKPNVKNSRGETPLHVAVRNRFFDYAFLLLKFKANPNITDENSRTPLHYAKDKRIIDLLISSGANNGPKNKNGRTTLNTDEAEDVCCIS